MSVLHHFVLTLYLFVSQYGYVVCLVVIFVRDLFISVSVSLIVIFHSVVLLSPCHHYLSPWSNRLGPFVDVILYVQTQMNDKARFEKLTYCKTNQHFDNLQSVFQGRTSLL